MKALSFKPRNLGLVVGVVLCAVSSPLVAKHHTAKEKAKEAVNKVADKLKEGVDRLGNNVDAIQDYFNHYQWKGLVEDKASSDVITLSNVTLNDHSRATVVSSGERIQGMLKCNVDKNRSSATTFYRVVLGFKGEGGQTTVCNSLGATALPTSAETFMLLAPEKPGFYQLRFRVAKSFTESGALESWLDTHGEEPDASTTIGVIYVKA